jgi:hypothetical protein
MADAVITTSWSAISAMIGITGSLIVLATAYLRLFVKGAIADLRQGLQAQGRAEQAQFEARFVQKELLQLQVGDLARRVDRLERNEGSE